MLSQQLKKKSWDPWSARLYQGAWAEAEAEREVGRVYNGSPEEFQFC